MIVLRGTGVFKDIAFGTLSMNKKSCEKIEKRSIEDVQSELNRFETAKKSAIEKTETFYEKSLKSLGEEEAQIFKVHKMMLEDDDYCCSVTEIIKNEKINAEYAVWMTCKKFSEMFSCMDDEYMKNRAVDIMDISQSLLDCLVGCEKTFENQIDDVIIAAADLTPSEVAGLDKSRVKGFVTADGSSCSHAAIIAKVMHIPAVVGLGDQLKPEYSGCKIILDSFSGKIYIDPDAEMVEKFTKRKKNYDNQKELLKKLKGKENITKDGQKIKIYANMNHMSEIDDILENDPGGIGLFRSEFLFLDRDGYPTEDEQFEVYKAVIEKMNGKDVIIRTLDIGSDKQADYFDLPKENNPAMGYRGIRLCLNRPELFQTQLKAIYRASVYGNVSIMFPMIISLKEVINIKKHIEIVKKDLHRKKIPVANDVKLGIMIETPAAVFISDELAKEVDFFSIGTNDLAQYSLAIDRQNSKVSRMFDSHHVAILKMIKMVVDNAHKNGIWVGLCGEIAADESLIETFLSLGVDELSMSAPCILNIRKKVLSIDVGGVRDNILKSLVY